jgi:MFS family permease
LICREYYADKRLLDPNFTYVPSGFGGSIDEQCRTPEVQAQVARFSLQGTLISGILSAIIAPKLGALSDRYGRKKMMIITNAGALSGEVITIFAATFPDTFPVYWILLGFFFDGICGSFIASMAISHSYATDCTPPDKRNVIFGYFHGMMFIGIALGPLIAARIIKITGGVITMFYIALGCHLAFILLLVFFIPESLSKARQMASREKYRHEFGGNPAGDWIADFRSLNIFGPLKILYPKGDGASVAVRRNLVLLASVDAICFGVGTGAITTIILYSQYRFKMTPEMQSNFIGIVNISRVACLLVILPAVTRFFRGKSSAPGHRQAPKTGTDLFELTVIRVAILFDVIGFLGYTLADSSNMFILAGSVASVGGVGSPTLQAALTKHVPPGQIGQLLGAMGLLHAFARIISPTVFNTVYALTVGKFDQTVFVMLTVLFSVAWMVSWLVKPGGKISRRNV